MRSATRSAVAQSVRSFLYSWNKGGNVGFGGQENGGTWLYFDGPRSYYSTSKHHGRRAIGTGEIHINLEHD
jgi:hypothetical protein